MHAIANAAMPADLVSIHHHEHLATVTIAVGGRHEPSPDSQLLKPGSGDVVAPGCSDDGVVGGGGRMPQPAVAKQRPCVFHPKSAQMLLGTVM